MARHAAWLGAQHELECETLASVPRLDWLSSSRRAILSGVELGMSELVWPSPSTVHRTTRQAFWEVQDVPKIFPRWSEMPRGTVCVCSHVSVQVLFSLPFPRASWLFSSWKDLGRLTQLCFQNLFRHLVRLLWTSDQHSQRHLPTQHNITQKYENVCALSEIRTHDLTF
jgi:hypothetical protein